MSSIFSKIVNREIPAHIVAEDSDHLAFLDINPLVKGHTLVIPKKEVDYIFDMEDEAYQKLHLFAKQVALSIKENISCLRVGVAVVGLEVPHVHIHLIPLNSMEDINFNKPKLQLSTDQLKEIASSISLKA